MPSFQDSMELSLSGRQAWKDYFKDLFRDWYQNIVNKEDDAEYQKAKLGDWVLHFIDYPKLTVETKTLSEKNYKAFKQTGRITLEIMGNKELKKTGSGIFACTADLFGYGFLVNGKLEGVYLIWLKEFLEWLEPRIGGYQTFESDTDGLYHTSWIFFPPEHFEGFLCKLPYK